MANGNEVKTHGQLINVPITINNVESSVNPHIMNDLSYDLILGRDWCEANGVILDFNKKKMYLIKPQEVQAISDSVFGIQLEDHAPKVNFDPHKIRPIRKQFNNKTNFDI